MTTDGMPTVAHAFAATVARRGDAPLITFYDDGTGERTELSGATLANWVAKTANLLVDGLGLTPGEVATVRLPPHWQTAAVLLGCWTAGLTVDLSGAVPAAVAFVAEPVEPLPAADEVFALALHPFGMPFRDGPPPGTADFIAELRPHSDRLPPPADRSEFRGNPEFSPRSRILSDRVLIDVDAHPEPAQWLVAPLLAGASIVLCRNLDATRLADRLATERAVQL